MKGADALRPAALATAAALAACSGGSDGVIRSAGWEFATAMSLRRSYVAAAEDQGSIYVAGGMVGETGRPLAVFQRYDPTKNSWTTLERLPEPIRAAAGAAIDGTIYVVGGQTLDGPGRGVYRYETRARRWRRGPPLPEPRFNHAAVSLGRKLYVLGGFHRGREQRVVYALDPAAGLWVVATRLPKPMHAFAAVTFRGEIWTIGGIRGERTLREVWIYSPATRRWRRGPTLPQPMELLGAAVARDQIHAVWESRYQIYDAKTQRWRTGPTLNVTRHGLALFAVRGSLYAIGGCTTELRDSAVVERFRLADAASGGALGFSGSGAPPPVAGGGPLRQRST